MRRGSNQKEQPYMGENVSPILPHIQPFREYALACLPPYTAYPNMQYPCKTQFSPIYSHIWPMVHYRAWISDKSQNLRFCQQTRFLRPKPNLPFSTNVNISNSNLQQSSFLTYFQYKFHIDITTWPNLPKFCSLTLSGASPPHPRVNAWLPKNSNLTQAKIF